MGMDVLEVNTPGELVMWLHLVQSEVRMEQDGAEIILDYMAEHDMKLAVCNQELVVLDAGEESHKCELKQAILVKLLYGTRYSGFFGTVFFLTNNVNTFYL